MNDGSADGSGSHAEPGLRAKAMRVGLGRAFEMFPDDVAAAESAAAQARAAMRKLAPLCPAEEPWPPMRTGAAR
ncbi:MAG: hypothetical protein AB7L76_10625 [Burkholderiaceae bacterium]